MLPVCAPACAWALGTWASDTARSVAAANLTAWCMNSGNSECELRCIAASSMFERLARDRRALLSEARRVIGGDGIDLEQAMVTRARRKRGCAASRATDPSLCARFRYDPGTRRWPIVRAITTGGEPWGAELLPA